MRYVILAADLVSCGNGRIGSIPHLSSFFQLPLCPQKPHFIGFFSLAFSMIASTLYFQLDLCCWIRAIIQFQFKKCVGMRWESG